MSRSRGLAGTAVAAAAGTLVLLPAPSASAHVHKITPLLCTTAPDNAGANQTNATPAAEANGGPISGVVPVVMSGGRIGAEEGGFDAAACTVLGGPTSEDSE